MSLYPRNIGNTNNCCQCLGAYYDLDISGVKCIRKQCSHHLRIIKFCSQLGALLSACVRVKYFQRKWSQIARKYQWFPQISVVAIHIYYIYIYIYMCYRVVQLSQICIDFKWRLADNIRTIISIVSTSNGFCCCIIADIVSSLSAYDTLNVFKCMIICC